MKMFIWNEPYRVKYGSAICYAVADTVEQARELAKAGQLRKFGLRGESAPAIELGEPTYIVECPCSEWYHWEE